jgi:hypothetical protein
VGDVPVAEPDRAFAERLEAGDQPQQRGLAAAGGPDEHHELAAPDRQVDAVHRLHGAGERLGHAVQDDLCHSLLQQLV